MAEAWQSVCLSVGVTGASSQELGHRMRSYSHAKLSVTVPTWSCSLQSVGPSERLVQPMMGPDFLTQLFYPTVHLLEQE